MIFESEWNLRPSLLPNIEMIFEPEWNLRRSLSKRLESERIFVEKILNVNGIETIFVFI